MLLKDHYPAYSSWEQFERHRRQLEANTNASAGVSRQGPSLLAGIVVGGRCGQRMRTCYKHNGYGLGYICCSAQAN